MAEFLGTMLLVATVVGSGIMAERLSPDDVGLQLLQNTAATVGILYVIILVFLPISGASFNPAVTLAAWALGHLERRDVAPYLLVQLAGGICGAILANLMFDMDPIEWSTKPRSDPQLWLSEAVATMGLVVVVFALIRSGRIERVAAAVAAFIGAGYYFTSSTSFANPAVTIGRMFSDSFAGIEPASAPMFVGMQILAVALAVPLIAWLWPRED